MTTNRMSVIVVKVSSCLLQDCCFLLHEELHRLLLECLALVVLAVHPATQLHPPQPQLLPLRILHRIQFL